MRTPLVGFIQRRRALRFLLPVGLALLCAPASRATTVIAPSFDELVNQADYIVRAVVRSVVPENRLMPGGGHTIFSKVELSVTETIAGSPPARVVLDVLGGTFEGRNLSIEGAPNFAVGDEGIYFVQGNGKQIYPLVRMMHGLYPIQKEPATGREYMIRSNGQPLVDVSQVSQDHEESSALDRRAQVARALTPAEFVTKIRAAAHEPHLRASSVR
ncbi:MAG: hypothetical protein JWM88_1684 [Verrucomicrobia bacterium]|nr:hypothetical protein [Verrucomicrobiota bacterium]